MSIIDVIKMEQRQRPSWDESFMLSAFSNAARSSCWHLHTGAVIVKDKRIIASGYNGAPPDIKNCLEAGCRKDREGIPFNEKGKGVCRGVHAEENAMNQIKREDLKGTALYSVYYPCSACAKSIVANGIEEVVYNMVYKEPDSLTLELFEEKKVHLRQFNINLERYFEMIRQIKGRDG